MADQKITQLTELTTPADDDVLAIVDDTGGSPTTKKVKWSNLVPNPTSTWVIGEVPTGTVNGTNTDFDTSSEPATGSLSVSINGIRLKITDDYTLSGSTITFVTAPETDDKILCDYFTTAGEIAQGSTSFVYDETPSGTVNGTNTSFSLANTPVSGTLQLFRDGQLLKGGSADYSISGTTITMTSAPVTGSVLSAFYQQSLTVAGNADTLDGEHLSGIIDLIYPVGAIFISTVSTNPGTYLGGTWTAFGAGKVLVGLDSGDADFDTAEETGGEKTHTLTEAEMPSHTHNYLRTFNGTQTFDITGADVIVPKLDTDGDLTTSTTNVSTTGSDDAHNNLQPYIVTYMFKRTA